MTIHKEHITHFGKLQDSNSKPSEMSHDHIMTQQGHWNKVPVFARYCSVRQSADIGDEFHFALQCNVISVK